MRIHRRDAGREDPMHHDAIAAFSTPPDVGWFADTISAQGGPDLSRELLKQRRIRFLSNAARRALAARRSSLRHQPT